MQDYFSSLQRHGTTEPFRNNMLDFTGLNEVLGTAEMLERGKRYDEAGIAPINRKGAAE